jgi:hypothetical protein
VSDSNAAKYTLIGTITAAVIGAIATVAVALVGDKAPASPTTPTTTPPGEQIPVAYQGNWDGIIHHKYGEFNVHMHLGPGAKGEVIGSYQFADCDGEISYQGGSGPVDVLFRAVRNPTGSCSPTASVKVAAQTSQTLEVYTYAGGSVSGEGTLSRS